MQQGKEEILFHVPRQSNNPRVRLNSWSTAFPLPTVLQWRHSMAKHRAADHREDWQISSDIFVQTQHPSSNFSWKRYWHDQVNCIWCPNHKWQFLTSITWGRTGFLSFLLLAMPFRNFSTSFDASGICWGAAFTEHLPKMHTKFLNMVLCFQRVFYNLYHFVFLNIFY